MNMSKTALGLLLAAGMAAPVLAQGQGSAAGTGAAGTGTSAAPSAAAASSGPGAATGDTAASTSTNSSTATTGTTAGAAATSRSTVAVAAQPTMGVLPGMVREGVPTVVMGGPALQVLNAPPGIVNDPTFKRWMKLR